jgi:hypothetical protein
MSDAKFLQMQEILDLLQEAQEASGGRADVDGTAAGALRRALDLAGGRARRGSFSDRTLASILRRARVFAKEIAGARCPVCGNEPAGARCAGCSDRPGGDALDELLSEINLARRRVYSRIRAEAEAAAFAPAGRRAAKASRAAGHLAALATSVLPAAERVRYAEEFASELHELASHGVGRRKQVAYAFRLACRAPSLCAGLRSQATRGKAST